jgi:hypothetical protein
MKKQLEIIAFGAIPFIIDREKRELKQFNKDTNVIRFDELKQEQGYYLASFDKNSVYLSTGRLDFTVPAKERKDIFIPGVIIEAPFSLSDNLKRDLNISSLKDNWGFYLGDTKIALRLSGLLPHVDLAGTDFTIDWRLKQLRETEFPWKNISFGNLELSDEGDVYRCFFNTETRELFEPDTSLFQLPDHIVVLEIPNELKLDPVAVARDFGIGETDLLIEHPYHVKITARVTPLAETGLSEFIAKNIQIPDKQAEGTERRPKRGR